MSKIFVVCPAGLVTGGAELLHQLVYELRSLGHEAFVSYWPFDRQHAPERAYLKYSVPTAPIEDAHGCQVIFPETLTRWSRCIERARCAIWWLSVDNYYPFAQDYRLRSPFVYRRNRLYNPVRKLRTLWLSRRPLQSMRGLDHYAQSHYAKEFLARAGIVAEMLTDYLSTEHFEQTVPSGEREDIIAYNPKKGIEITSRLIETFPDLEFRPIQDMTSAQVAAFLRSVKLYIDFGNHPGKDRPPREAVMAGCCVITGRSGAADVEEDTPISDDYRIDPYEKNFMLKFERSARDVFTNFSANSTRFDLWRAHIRDERSLFQSQVISIFGVARSQSACARCTVY